MKLVFDSNRLKDMALSESGFLFDPSTGYTYTLNEVGREIFNGLKEGLSKDKILDKIKSEFDLPDDVSHEQDYEDFVYRLRDVGLLLARQVEEDESSDNGENRAKNGQK